MPRARPGMTIATDCPVQQTFLLSPTPSPSPTRIRADSPILPPPLVSPLSPILPLFHNRRFSTPISTLPAYPTPRSFYDDSLSYHTALSAHSPTSSDLSTAQTAVEGNLVPQTVRLSDILPSDMDLYIDDDEEGAEERLGVRRWSIVSADEQPNVVIEPDATMIEQPGELGYVEPVPIREEDVEEIELGPEVQGTLTTIKETDFPYNPPPSHYRQPRRERENEGVAQTPSRKVAKKHRGDGSDGGMRILWKRMLRKLKKMRKL